MSYDHKFVEKKWQAFWEKEKTFCALRNEGRKKCYVLDMFPYPSGAGLHMGHLCGYTYSDVYARYMRMCQFDVLHPMGWDSFGLPAEQYAIRTGVHPKETTKNNIDSFRLQLKSMGFSYDWEREITTSAPEYYKWTQWIFSILYERGLAYQAKVSVNYCPKLNTVLANEEIEHGVSKDGGHPIELRPLRQWMLRITEYADRLLSDLDDLEWPEEIKQQQRFWIGKKEGVEILFKLVDEDLVLPVFTTRPETIFGISYIALCFDHPLLDHFIKEDRISVVEEYREQAKKRRLVKNVTSEDMHGVFLGCYAVHPFTGESIAIWAADYVLSHVGSGIVMGVPAHDENDYSFASVHQLQSLSVIASDVQPYIGHGQCINSHSDILSLNGICSKKAREIVINWLEKNELGSKKITYRLRDWLFSRQRYWGEPIPIIHWEDGSIGLIPDYSLPLTLPEVESFKPEDNGISVLDSIFSWVNVKQEDTCKKGKRETNTMPQWAGSCWYFLRFCDSKNMDSFCSSENEQAWMPVDVYVGGAEHAVLHLLYARFWHKVLFDSGLVSSPEPFLRLKTPGMVLAYSYKKSSGEYVSPDEVYDCNGLFLEKSTNEKLIKQLEKMGKSKLNGVSPDSLLLDFGSDALRLYVVFLAPLEKEKIWSTEGLSGCKRFLNKIFSLWGEGLIKDCSLECAGEFVRFFANTFKAICEDYFKWSFNTVISKLMEIINFAKRTRTFPKQCFEIFVKLLAPLAPHLAEELWSFLGHKGTISTVEFPLFGGIWEKLAEEEFVSISICFNGKRRGEIRVEKGSDQNSVVSRVKQDNDFQKYFENHYLKRVIFVQDKLLNLLVILANEK